MLSFLSIRYELKKLSTEIGPIPQGFSIGNFLSARPLVSKGRPHCP